MRKLNTQDIFSAMRVIKQCNLRTELKPIMELAAKGEVDTSQIGIDAILTIIETFANKGCEKAFYEFLSHPFEISAKDIEIMPLDEFASNVERLATENDLRGFFTSLSRLAMKK